ncbi:starch-binding protein [Bifidobacterium thermophilum]|uniref:starch-binding protein n=1 Tax=Bifidobacterium thermophilum TaxID=33905 RepID=UPI0039930C8A
MGRSAVSDIVASCKGVLFRIVMVLVVVALGMSCGVTDATAGGVESGGVQPGSAASASSQASDDSVTVHFYDADGWRSPYLYYYSGSQEPVAWPGVVMQSDGGGWYSYRIAGMSSARVLFSDRGASQYPARGEDGIEISGERWVVGGDVYDTRPSGITVHCFDYYSWGDIHVYWYGASGASRYSWPGVRMFPDGDGWWSYTVFGAGDSVKVLFSDGANRQTPARMEDGFQVSGEMWYRGGQWSQTRPDGVSVLFRKPEGWSNPRIYYYSSDSDTGPAWPGSRMRRVSGDWWAFTITKYATARVLFSDGSRQVPGVGQPGYPAEGACMWNAGAWSCSSGAQGESGGGGLSSLASADVDSDGIPDVLTAVLGEGDSDGDGLPDDYEVARSATDPDSADTDGDGVVDGESDTDGDELTALREYREGTDPVVPDSDGDGLADGRESDVTHTDPLKGDSDGDGVDDWRECLWGTDPLSAQTDFAVTAPAVNDDGSVDDAVSVSVDLPASQAATLEVRPSDEHVLLPDDMPGVIGSGAYRFTADGDIGTAELHFRFDAGLAADPSFDPVVCWFDEENQRLVELPTVVSGSTATATTTHFSTYVLVNRTVFEDSFSWEDDWSQERYTSAQVVLVIDDSGSMSWNDPSGKRLEVARTLVGRFPSGTKTGVVRFSHVSTTLTGLTTDASAIGSALADSNYHASGGTNMYTAVSQALGLFEGDDDTTLRTVVVLSDGETDDTSMHDQVVQTANTKKVKINAVGLGGGGPGSYYERWMQLLASQTAGESYLAENADGLAGIYERIGTLVDMQTDSDGDGISDWYEEHLTLFNGLRLRLDPDDPDTDGDGIPDGKEIDRLDYEYNADHSKVKVTGRLVSDPTSADSDGDGLEDAEERLYLSSPLKADSDHDGLQDGAEVISGSDPANANPDQDHIGDRDELAKGTNPYEYDKTWTETLSTITVGAIFGDFITDDDPMLCIGQILGGFVPVSDLRDLIANLYHEDYGFAVVSFVGIIPMGGDAAKAALKAVRFLRNTLHVKPASAGRLLRFLERHMPDVLDEIGEVSDTAELARKLSNVSYGTFDRASKDAFVKALRKARLGKYIIKTADIDGVKRIDVDFVWFKQGDRKYRPLDRGRAADREINLQDRVGERDIFVGSRDRPKTDRVITPLGITFKTADRLERLDGVDRLVSTKTLDLDAAGNLNVHTLKSTIEKDLNALDDIEKGMKGLCEDITLGNNCLNWPYNAKHENIVSSLHRGMYQEKVLEIVVPDTAVSDDVRRLLCGYAGVNRRAGPLPIKVEFVIGGK